jgi:hypothetical protein
MGGGTPSGSVSHTCLDNMELSRTDTQAQLMGF